MITSGTSVHSHQRRPAAVIASSEARVHPIRAAPELLTASVMLLTRPQHQDQQRRERAMRVHKAVRHLSPEHFGCFFCLLFFVGAELNRTESGLFLSRTNGAKRPSRCAITRV